MSHTRDERIAAIDQMIRQITWQGQKKALQTLSQPDIALTMPQMITLFAIRSAQRCRMSELADVTQQSAGTLTGIVDRLIEDELVARVRDSSDRRVVQVMLTPEGHERLRRVEHARHEDMAHMLNRFTLEQLDTLGEMLDILLLGIYDWMEHEAPPANHGVLPTHAPAVPPMP